MIDNLSKIGFGTQPFGEAPFGGSDWAEEVLFHIIPEFYRNLDAKNINGLVANPLRKLIDSIKPDFQEIKDKWDIFPTLWDANKCPFPQLPALGYNVGIDISPTQNLKLIDIASPPFTVGEEITGITSGTTGFLASATQLNLVISGIKGPGFKPGETLQGGSTGKEAIISSITGSGSIQTITINFFALGEIVQGIVSGTRGVVGSISSGNINVNTITGIGFSNGEEIKGLTSEITAVINGITSDGKNEALLRSQVLNANQLWLNKGTVKGYSIIAAFEGLFVLVTPYWAETCDPDPNFELLVPEEPIGQYLSYFDLENADQIGLDTLYPDEETAWPRRVESVEVVPGFPETGCRSFTISLFFFTPDNTEIENFDTVSARLLNSIEKFRPIYVNIKSTTFDGPRASSQLWQAPTIYAENSSTGLWTSNVTGSLVSVSNLWQA